MPYAKDMTSQITKKHRSLELNDINKIETIANNYTIPT